MDEDQRRLHAWPDWDASIRRARALLEFEPQWTPRPGSTQSPAYIRWRGRVTLRRLLAEAGRALTELHLPEQFTDYWLACFLAPYDQDGLETIRDPQPSGDIGPARVFPPPRAQWFSAGIDASSAPAKLVIEGPAALASSALLRHAERRALAARRAAGLGQQHPFSHSRQLGPAQENRAATRARGNPARAKAIRSARAWHASGEKPWYIAKQLGQRGYPVSERTVRRWLAGDEVTGR